MFDTAATCYFSGAYKDNGFIGFEGKRGCGSHIYIWDRLTNFPHSCTAFTKATQAVTLQISSGNFASEG